MRSRWSIECWASVGVSACLVAAACGSDGDATSLRGRAHTEGRDGEAAGAPGSLDETGSPPIDEGAPPPGEVPSAPGESSELDAMARRALCAALGEDRSQANLIELHRLGLEMSSVRLEGSLGSPVQIQGMGHFAPLQVEKVWVGPTFLEGARAYIPLDEAEREGLSLPGRYLLGFGSSVDLTGVSFPSRLGNEASGRWEKEVVIPIADRELFSDLLSYGVPGEPLVAVVQISAADADVTTLGVAQVLAGDIPSPIRVSWDRTVPGIAYPPVNSGQYLATFASVARSDDPGSHVGQLLDFRPYDAGARALAQRAIAAPRRSRDRAPLLEAAQAYRTGWLFHRAPLVVATEITGVAYECCTSTGGTYLEHAVVGALRGAFDRDRLMLGGHAYFSEEQCGDAFLLAVGGLDAASPAEPSASFACAPGASRSIARQLLLPQVMAGFPESAASRERVGTWLSSPDPVYLLWRESDERSAATLGVHAVWSQPMPLESALVAAPLSWINILGSSDANNGRIDLETSFSPTPAEERMQRFTLETSCSDPMLRRAGAVLAPVVDGELLAEHTTEPQAFIVPGVTFPNYGYIARIADKFRRAVDADRVLYPAPHAPLRPEP